MIQRRLKVMVVSASHDYLQLFKQLGFTLTEVIDDADLICFTGGSDVSPHLYGAVKHPRTYSHLDRDLHEQAVFQAGITKKIPMVGICRGGQFLNVMSGGEMYQDVESHTRPHEITDLLTGEVVLVSSTHHQMMKPSPKGLLVASSGLGGAREWYEGQVFKRDVSKEDIEVVWYEDTKCLCFQPHPEFNGSHYYKMKSYFNGLLYRFIFKETDNV